MINLLLLLFTLSFSHAEDFLLQSNGTKLKIPFIKVDGFLVNDICKEKGSSCIALKMAKANNKISSYPKQNLSSPAQDFCKIIGGTALTLLKPDLSGVSFCLFEDHTIISSWDLFTSRSPNKRAEK
jgi:putative hemolysin